jgi:hypothetical protein
MSDWLHGLPVAWMALVVFGITYLVSAAIYATVRVLANDERGRAFKAVTSSLLSPLGVLFGLLVVFTADEVWRDNMEAGVAVVREATALRAALMLSDSLPDKSGADLRAQIRRYVQEVATTEWPAMAAGTATLRSSAHHLAGAMVSILTAAPDKKGQQAAQAAIVTRLQAVLEARRRRILISQRQVDFAKWLCISISAISTLFAIAMIHSGNRLAAMIAMGLFATGVGASVLLVLAYDRPFVGQLAIGPQPLLQAATQQ